jgi:hypothetical protein
MTALFIFLIPFAIAMVITYNWIKGIEHMQKNHPDYKGEDLFDENVDTK